MSRLNVVISQSMYFPWVGMLEQIRLADVFVFYDDVQFSKGSFSNRVQVKLPGETTAWMTVPLLGHKLGQRVDQVRIKPAGLWVEKHLAMLEQSYEFAPFSQEALELASDVLYTPAQTVSQLSRESMMAMSRYFGLDLDTVFLDSRDLNIPGSGSQRVFDIVKHVGGKRYITGHGAKNYLEHELFEAAGVEVAYMEYEMRPYPQEHGKFTPYLSGLDLIASVGRGGLDYIASQAVDWRKFKL
jgi:WbqC-like protein family